ncbi:phosphatidylinositol phosphate synthase [uncultured Corynebacterium sp.]|uniref:phosphatidylinositol phosphate synthase n=1 Tax=uncultured Corynebacterium sp. TaxID=159447 RepID=UPI0025EFD7B2|nr:CDP-alcohol phosphatidyltransferase family protein [uncultured Corynebacterium sp.]
MLSAHGRKPIAPVVEPIARALNSAGVSPNAMTIVGTVAAIVIAVTLIPAGHLFAAAALTGIFAAFDLLDGTMARLRGGGTRFGAVLDASCDRITDGVLFGAILWWVVHSHGAPTHLIIATLTCLVGGQVTSYVKARAEASGFTVVGGLIERPERLIISLVGIGFEGLGIPWAVEIALWVLAVGSVVTVVQRLVMVGRAPEADLLIDPPAGKAASTDADPSDANPSDAEEPA